MMFSSSSSDYRPLFWVGGRPISATLFIIILHVVAMVAVSLCMATGHYGYIEPFRFYSTDVLYRGHVWQFLTYPFVEGPNLVFLINTVMLFWFGPDVERFIGRNQFLGLYASLVIIPALFLTGWGALVRPVVYEGGSMAQLGVFIAFVAIYPNVELLFRIQAKWMAAVILALYTLQFLATKHMVNLGMLWLTTVLAAVYIRSQGVATGLGFLDRVGEWWENWRAERLARKNNIRLLEEQEKTQSIDAILDKISKHGMGSLSPLEKKILERASADLIKRDKPH